MAQPVPPALVPPRGYRLKLLCFILIFVNFVLILNFVNFVLILNTSTYYISLTIDMELVHDIQLTSRIRTLMMQPWKWWPAALNILPSSGVNCWDFPFPLCYMHQVRSRQPQNELLTPTFVVVTIKWIQFDCRSKFSYRKPINNIMVFGLLEN